MNTLDRLAQRFPRITAAHRQRELILAAFCGFVIFSALTSFEDPPPSYHEVITTSILLFASLLLLPGLLLGACALPIRASIVPLAAVGAVFLVATLLSSSPYAALARLKFYYSLALLWLALVGAFSRCRLSAVTTVLLVIACTHVVFLIIGLHSVLEPLDPGTPRFTPLPHYAHIRHLAYHGFLGACAGLSLFVLSRHLRTVGLLLTVASLFGIVIFGSRGALGAWLVFAGGVVVLLPGRQRTLIAAVVVLLASLFLAYGVDKAGLLKTDSLFSRVQAGPPAAVINPNGRLEIWRDALVAASRKPLLGYGPEAYLTSQCCNHTNVQPHNLILQTLLEAGLVGLLAILWLARNLLQNPIRRFIGNRRRGEAVPELVVLLSTISAFTAFSMIDGLFYHAIPLLHFVILTALLVGLPWEDQAA